MRKKIIGIGNALVDALVRIPGDQILDELKLPKGSMQLIDTDRYRQLCSRMEGMEVQWATGGSACNTILALAHLGMAPALIGKVAADERGGFFRKNCESNGICPYLLSDSLPTGVASTFITPDGQRTFGTYLGAAARLTVEDLDRAWFDGYDYFYIEGYLVQNHALIDGAVDMARQAGQKVCLDLASYNIVEGDRDFFAHLLEKTDIVFANEEEAYAFTGKSPEEALADLSSRCEVAVVKVGKKGSMGRCGEHEAHQSAQTVGQVIDTTAAGDFFAAGFLYAHAQGRQLEECLYAGDVLAGSVIQVVGTQLPETVWADIRRRIG